MVLSILFCTGEVAYSLTRWDFTSNVEGWTARNSATKVRWSGDHGGSLYMDTYGSDPGMVGPSFSLGASTNNLVRMYAWTYCDDKNAEIFFMRSGSSTVYSGGGFALSQGESGGTYEVDMRLNPNWTGTITQLRIDPAGNCGSVASPGFVAFDYIEIVEKVSNPPVVTQFDLDQTEISHGWNLGVSIGSFDPDGDSYNCEWKVGSGSWNPTGTNNGHFTIPSSNFSPGQNSVYVKCTDVFGKYGQPSPKTVTDYLVPSSAPGSLSPGNGVELPIQSSYSFSFAAVTNSHHYRAVISDSADFTNILYNQEKAGSPFSVGDDILTPGRAYYWKIRGENILGTGGPYTETSFRIASIPADLSVTVDSIPSNAQRGTTIPVTCTVKKDGGAFPSSGFVRVYLYLNQSASSLTGARRICDDSCGFDFETASLTDGQETRSKSVTIPIDVEGPYYVIAKVDGSGHWAESDENNNLGSSTTTLLVWQSNTPPDNEPMGILARTWHNPSVYWIKYGKKWPFEDWNTLASLGYTDADVHWYSVGALDVFSAGKTILQDNDNFVYRRQNVSTVYIIRNGKSDWFFNWEAFVNSEFGTNDVYWATDVGFNWIQSVYPPGQMIGSQPRIRVAPSRLYFE